jgi:hypothetical protein
METGRESVKFNVFEKAAQISTFSNQTIRGAERLHFRERKQAPSSFELRKDLGARLPNIDCLVENQVK